ncbi:MAG: DUF1405 domain-containing protein [Staphylococcus equorum]|uniref:DUF1405 domain-containing protein n=1 Tax=Staphylococcus TaxID=1279 RepID=UPI000623D9E9|nr:DUF1405 domain-containing protein [Staphylococcus equorum]KKI54371.1 putative transmembrane protein [Staphylococcus equorum subsp. equorum]MDG0822120.1 DUF1405 domain-containing protein [Staphylococcus equorum]MDG0838042.1 DUF1405 domain-containing protein [Staphylococcus equorum]MDK9870859.1 DUF1405 domain-containing protein [Staphylococcus equorum]MDK9876257.1 DUF1405 domain-containing protein [Staphylococcus equorum]
MNIKYLWHLLIYNKGVLYFLLICNLLGTIYGYIWYGSQLSVSSWQFVPFVPDSPTASLFLCIALIGLIAGKNLPIIEALAFVSLIKYGVWAVIMNIIMFIQYDSVTIIGCMLILSHGIMAIEAFFFYPRFKITIPAFTIAVIWVFHNDIIDYVFMQYPYYDFIASHIEGVAYLAFWLSVIPLVLYLNLTRFKKDKIFDHH